MTTRYAERPWNAQRIGGLLAALAVNAGLIALLANGLNIHIWAPPIDDMQVFPVKPEKPLPPDDVSHVPPVGKPVWKEPPMKPWGPIQIDIAADPPVGGAGPVIPAGDTTPVRPAPSIIELQLDPAYAAKPNYPVGSIRRNEEGIVTLLIRVLPDGTPAEVRVLESSGHRSLDASAVRAAKEKWRFRPRVQDGVPVEAWGRYDVVFRLQ